MKTLAQIFDEENQRNGLAAIPSNTLHSPASVGIKIFRNTTKTPLANGLPTRLKVLSWGENTSTQGTFRAGPKTASALPTNQKAMGFSRVAIDYDHCSVPGTETNKSLLSAGQPPLIFGYGDVVPIVGDGIYLENIAWTPLGVQHAKNFEDISPALKDDNGEVVMIHSAALTPNGSLHDLPGLVEQMKTFSARNPLASSPSGQRRQVDLAEIFDREHQAATAALSASGQTIRDGKFNSAALPTTLTIFPWGGLGEDSAISYLNVNQTTADLLPKWQNALGLNRVKIYAPDDSVAGNAAVSVTPERGLALDDIVWMNGASQAITANGTFCPCIYLDDDKNIVALDHVTLCPGNAITTFETLSLPQHVTLTARSGAGAIRTTSQQTLADYNSRERIENLGQRRPGIPSKGASIKTLSAGKQETEWQALLRKFGIKP